MRLVKEIPHERYKIQIHQYNGKYIVKIELGQFAQTYKIGETDVYGVEDIETMITKELLKGSLDRFIEMRNDWQQSFEQINKQR
jgi:hypothetical protein